MDRQRTLSALVFVGAVVAASARGGLEPFLILGSSLLLCLSLVWYAEEWGSLIGIGTIVTQTSPAPLVRFFGWIFLLAGAAACFTAAFE